MLDALSARSKLYISWAGRNVRDNSEQPPSVLVSQLRDYSARAGMAKAAQAFAPASAEICCWPSVPASIPCSPFSRRYFEQASGLSTFAREWYGAHEERVAQALPVVAAFRARSRSAADAGA
jgi:exodeoxyribonuclease V gamma subunit